VTTSVIARDVKVFVTVGAPGMYDPHDCVAMSNRQIAITVNG
jgi:hypothetical protein